MKEERKKRSTEKRKRKEKERVVWPQSSLSRSVSCSLSCSLSRSLSRSLFLWYQKHQQSVQQGKRGMKEERWKSQNYYSRLAVEEGEEKGCIPSLIPFDCRRHPWIKNPDQNHCLPCLANSSLVSRGATQPFIPGIRHIIWQRPQSFPSFLTSVKHFLSRTRKRKKTNTNKNKVESSSSTDVFLVLIPWNVTPTESFIALF